VRQAGNVGGVADAKEHGEQNDLPLVSFPVPPADLSVLEAEDEEAAAAEGDDHVPHGVEEREVEAYPLRDGIQAEEVQPDIERQPP
jgi:hypothetical protein